MKELTNIDMESSTDYDIHLRDNTEHYDKFNFFRFIS